MRLLAVGRLRPGPQADLFAEYARRLRPVLDVTEIADSPGAQGRARENAALRAAIPPRCHCVALDQEGACHASDAFARALARWQSAQAPLVFLIGGAEGLEPQTRAAAQDVLSLGPMTWPHMLVRGLLAEQLYRAQCILSGHPYHRAGR